LRLGIIVVNYNGRAYVGDCLRALRASRRRPDTIVCVDQASNDGSADFIAKEFPEVTLLRSSTNTGFTGGVNLGAEYCLAQQHEAVVLLNPDTVVDPDFLGRLVSAAGRHPKSILAPAIRLFNPPHASGTYAGTVRWWCGKVAVPARIQSIDDAGADQRITTASGCCLFIPAQALRDIGLLDESYFLYFEDADFLERAASSGYEVWYVPSAVVLHKESSATGGRQSPLAMYYFIRNRHYFVRKHRRHTPVYGVFLVYALADVTARLLTHITTASPSLAAAVLRGAIDGWRGRQGRCVAIERVARARRAGALSGTVD
jgi:hypothetical protein